MSSRGINEKYMVGLNEEHIGMFAFLCIVPKEFIILISLLFEQAFLFKYFSFDE